MTESESCERSKKIDYLSLLKWSDNDTKTFSGILNSLIEKVSKQIDNIENVVMCSQDDQLFQLSSEGSPSDTEVAARVGAKSALSQEITRYEQSSRSPQGSDQTMTKCPTLSRQASLEEPVERTIFDSDFQRKKYNLLQTVKSLEPSNPSNILKLEKIRKIIKESQEQAQYVDNNAQCQSNGSKANLFSWEEDKTDFPVNSNSVRSQVLSQRQSYMKVLDSFNNPCKNIPQFEPWDELFKTIQNNSIASSRDEEITVNLDSRMKISSASSEQTDSRYQDIDSSSDNNMRTIDSASSACDEGSEPTERKKRNRPRNYINLVIQLKDDKKNAGTQAPNIGERRNVKFKDERNQFSLSVPSEMTNKITLQNAIGGGKERKTASRIQSLLFDTSAIRRSTRRRKKRKYFGDFDSCNSSSSDDDTHNDQKDFKTVLDDCQRDQTLIENFLGEKYRCPVIEVRELEPTILSEFQRLADVLE